MLSLTPWLSTMDGCGIVEIQTPNNMANNITAKTLKIEEKKTPKENKVSLSNKMCMFEPKCQVEPYSNLQSLKKNSSCLFSVIGNGVDRPGVRKQHPHQLR